MAEPVRQVVTRVLHAATRGEPRAAEELLPLVYDELRNLARSRLAKQAGGQTLQPTALVHEAYLRLVGDADPGWDGRRHFFGAAARAMREILIEQARRKGSLKHGGGWRRANPDNLIVPVDAPAEDMLALVDALELLEREDPRKHEIVMLRFFAGLTAEETAEALNTPLRTVERHWRYARAWLHMRLTEPQRDARTT